MGRITARQLATHTSGLPFCPDDFPAERPADYQHYSSDDLILFLKRHSPATAPGEKWGYSNLNGALLGTSVARAAGTEYSALLDRRVTGPLGMAHTSVTGGGPTAAGGHDKDGNPAPPWNVPAFLGSGSLWSTADDLVTFLEVVTGRVTHPLAESVADMWRDTVPAMGFDQAIGWMVLGAGDAPLLIHDGGTFGFAASFAIDPKADIGVVVLSNTAESVSDIARHLVRPETFALSVPEGARPSIDVNPEVLARYVGRFQLDPEAEVLVSLDGGELTVTLPMAPPLPLRAESETVFFLAVNQETTIVFNVDAEGHAPSLTLRSPAGRFEAGRLSP